MINKNLPRRSSISNVIFIVLTLVFGYFLNQEKIDHQMTKDDLVLEQQLTSRLVADTMRYFEENKSLLWFLKEVKKQNGDLKRSNKSFLGQTATDSLMRIIVDLKMENSILQHELEQYEDNAALDERSQKIFRFNQKNSTHPRNMELALQ